ncbi:hypothetical protein [Mycobacterium sp. NPDC050041]|uniref:hypothetical protein n=1 Tax=Mycobacterium sp. NPDC050041 TaxID=3364293 RepID=UPI003C2DD757
MAVATITLESLEGGEVADSVVVSAPNEEFLLDDIILDTEPDGLYDTRFTIRTQSGAFEPGGRIVGEEVPIREMTLPFHLTPESRRRFQRLWGTPYHLRKVRWIYDGPSGPRTLILKLAKEILYTTEDGFDADIDDAYHAVVTAIGVNPMYEGAEDVAEWVNPDDRFTMAIVAAGGTYSLTFGGQTTDVFSVGIVGTGGTFTLTFGGQPTTAIPYNAAPSVVEAALEALSTVGVDNVSVGGTAGNYLMVFATSDALSGSATNLTGGGKAVNITAGLPYNSNAATVQVALEALSSVGPGKVAVTGTPASFLVVFDVGTNGVLTGSATNLTGLGKKITIDYAPNTGWFEVWNPTDQELWPEWAFDPAKRWQFPDFAFGRERRWNRPVGADAARMIVTPQLTQLLSVMSDPFMDTYVNADLSNAAGLFNGVEPVYSVPPYTGTEDDPVLMPVICQGPAGVKATLRQRRFWSAESGLEA